MSSIYSIYKATNTINGKVYIGFDSNWPNRKRIHKSNSSKKDYHFYRAIRKHGWDNFQWEIIYQSKDKLHCKDVMEPYFIKLFDTFTVGYNKTMGGEGVFGLQRIQSPEEKQKRSLLMRGNNHGSGNKNKPLSKERKQKLSDIKKSVILTCPHCNKTGGAGMTRWHFNNCRYSPSLTTFSSI
jgi:group I intron endonuclease